MVWDSHLFKNFPQFVVIQTVKSFSVVNEAEVYVFLELSCFIDDPTDVGNLICGSSAFSKSSLYIWKTAVGTGLAKASFHSNSKEGQRQRMFRLLYSCTNFTCWQVYAEASAICEL